MREHTRRLPEQHDCIRYPQCLRYRGVAGDGKRLLRGWKRSIGSGGGVRSAGRGVALIVLVLHGARSKHGHQLCPPSGCSVRSEGRRLLVLKRRLLLVQIGVGPSAEVVFLAGSRVLVHGFVACRQRAHTATGTPHGQVV